MRYDPFTLVIVLGNSGDAEGTLYLDDGESFDFEEGAAIHRKFSFVGATGTLMSEDLATATAPSKKAKDYLKLMEKVRVEKIIIVNASTAWKGKSEVEVSEGLGGKSSAAARKATLDWHDKEGGKAAWAVVRDPGVRIGAGWKIAFV